MTVNNPPDGYKTGMPRILIVDDESSVRHVLSTFLRRKGCEIQTAETSEEASGLLPAFRPDVALVDIVLPGKDGIHLLEQIKRLSPDVEVVLITSHGSVESAIKAIRHGAYDYLNKPFRRLEDVWLTVLRALEQRHLSQQMHDLVRRQGLHGEEISRTVEQLATSDEATDLPNRADAAEPAPVGDSES